MDELKGIFLPWKYYSGVWNIATGNLRLETAHPKVLIKEDNRKKSHFV